MIIRQFQPGDEFEQLKVFNTAAGGLPKFKLATILDIQRRTQAKDFDPATRLYAEEAGAVVGYCTWQANGRIGYPWCLPGFEAAAEPLLDHALKAMQQRGVAKAFCAYRKDWPGINTFFQNRGFVLAREMINYVLAFDNMPTPSAQPSSMITPARIDDLPGIFALAPTLFRVPSAAALTDALWKNPYFGPESLFVMRNRTDGSPVAAGNFIINNIYADPRKVDADMPCFRLGTFGSEGNTAKRIKGLFSFVTKPDRNVFAAGMDMLSYAANMLKEADDIACFAAQVPSDAPALVAFYQQAFERQGSFPIYERNLT